jgi:hypothetical protein
MVMPGEVDPEYGAWFSHRLLEAALQARAAAVPAHLSLSSGEGELGINRRLMTAGGCVMRPNPAGINDTSVRTAWFHDEAGQRIASLTIYACHPTSRAGQLIGGDYPGFFSAALEADGGGAALFAVGCAGDIRPNFTGPDGGFRQATLEEVRAAGEQLAARIGRPKAAAVERVSVAASLAWLPFSPVPSAWVDAAHDDPDPLRRAWARRLCSEGSAPACGGCEIQVLALARAVAWIFMSGEIVVDFAFALSRAAAPAVIPAGYANASVGYVPSRRIYPEGGYEVDGAYLYYGQPGPFTPEAEEIVLAKARELLAEAMGGEA